MAGARKEQAHSGKAFPAQIKVEIKTINILKRSAKNAWPGRVRSLCACVTQSDSVSLRSSEAKTQRSKGKETINALKEMLLF